MKVWIIMENSYLAYEFDDTEVHSVVDSQEKAEQFIKDNPPVKIKYGGTVRYYFIEKEVQ